MAALAELKRRNKRLVVLSNSGRRAALNDSEIDDIVEFLHTLTDGWTPVK